MTCHCLVDLSLPTAEVTCLFCALVCPASEIGAHQKVRSVNGADAPCIGVTICPMRCSTSRGYILIPIAEAAAHAVTCRARVFACKVCDASAKCRMKYADLFAHYTEELGVEAHEDDLDEAIHLALRKSNIDPIDHFRKISRKRKREAEEAQAALEATDEYKTEHCAICNRSADHDTFDGEGGCEYRECTHGGGVRRRARVGRMHAGHSYLLCSPPSSLYASHAAVDEVQCQECGEWRDEDGMHMHEKYCNGMRDFK
jgi:hypothetical protein